jgi:hypothetical protein
MGLGRVSIPTNSSFEETAKILNDLVKKMPSATEEIKKVKGLREGLNNVTQRVKEAKEKASEANTLAKEAKGKIDELKNLGKEFNKYKGKIDKAVKTTDALNKGQWSKVGTQFGRFMSLGLIALTIFSTILGFANTWAINSISESTIAQFERNGKEFTLQFNLIQKSYLQINQLKAQFSKLKADLDATKASVYGDVQSLLQEMPKVRNKANDALYEARAGRKIVEGKVDAVNKKANDALYEVRQGRKLLEDKINLNLKNIQANLKNIQNQFNSSLQGVTNDFSVKLSQITSRVNQGLTEAKLKATQSETKVNQLESKLKLPGSSGQSDTKTAALEAKIKSLESKLNETVINLPPRITRAIEPVKEGLIVLGVKISQQGIEITKLGKASDLVKETQTRKQNDNEAADRVLAGGLSALAARIDAEIKPQIQALKKPQVDSLSPHIGNLEAQIKEIKVDIKKQGDMNEAGNKKLDQMLPLIGLIPAIPGRAADAIRPSIPTLPQIENASATGTCRTLQPGGCSRRALDDLGNGINENTNQASNNLLDKITAGLSGANAAASAAIKLVVDEINGKMGPLLPGGISGFLENFLKRFNKVAKWLHLDRALNILIWWQTLHNASMLSTNVAQTLGSGINNVLGFLGIKDAEGDPLDIGAIVGKAYSDALKTALGETTYNNLNVTWNAANRIYQSVSNLASLVQSMQQTVLSALEYIGAAQGKVANALKAAGKVFENAYEWMNTQPNFDNPLFARLEKFQETASIIEQITQVPVDIKSNIDNLKQEKNNMKEALKDGENALKGIGIIESDNEKKKAVDSKKVSAGKDLDSSDKVEADNE